MKFSPEVCPVNTKWESGYAGGPGKNVHKVADEAFGGKVPGEWLTCYMLRRFGHPNAGSDPHKDLCAWMLTTPIAGLFLIVHPYLGGGGNYHFAIRYTKEVGHALDRDPGREAVRARREKAIRRWWDTRGGKLYALGMGKKEGDEDELVHLCGEKDGLVGGLWRRPLKHDRPHDKLPKDDMVLWWLGCFIEKQHPEVKLPMVTKRERAQRTTRYQHKAKAAVIATMRALLRPTNVRDLDFNIYGRDNDKSVGPHVEPFADAGYAAEHLYTVVARKRRADAKRASA